MDTRQPIFAQIMEFLPGYDFQKCVQRYNGQYKIIKQEVSFRLFLKFSWTGQRGSAIRAFQISPWSPAAAVDAQPVD